MTEKTGFSFRRFGRFFLLNLIIFASVFIIFLAITIIISLAIKKQYLQITTLIVLVLLALITYSFLNFSHSYFMLKPGSIKSTLKSSLKKTFRRLSSYYKIYIISLLFFIAYIIIYYPFALLLKSTLPQNALRYLPIYVRAFTIITLIIIYLITAHNRIYFYMNTKEAITPL
ncbi:hypothetical protein CMO89_01840 [Candidatus Woesearchaeota archaeon]|nr:hypothetical protein [Candidatus Woesearchaeota archaeon]